MLVRHGYSACNGCHISPSGGGLLNDYGRVASEEFLSTWSYEKEGNLAYIPVDQSKYLKSGGDVRWINYTVKSPYGDKSDLFFMQIETEHALKPVDGLTIVGTIGKYGKEGTTQYRRNYILIEPNDSLHFRMGRYFPDYGLLVPDHNDFIHPGEGNETFNTEFSFTHSLGGISLGHINGSPLNEHADSEHGYSTLKSEGDGYVAKAYLVPTQFTIIGYGYQRTNILKQGPYAILGYWNLYLLFQLDMLVHDTIRLGQLNFEVYKGVHAAFKAQSREGQQRYTTSLTLFPRPHFEFSAEYQRNVVKNIGYDAYLFLGHFYL